VAVRIASKNKIAIAAFESWLIITLYNIEPIPPHPVVDSTITKDAIV
jgi:hypothetical protein